MQNNIYFRLDLLSKNNCYDVFSSLRTNLTLKLDILHKLNVRNE